MTISDYQISNVIKTYLKQVKVKAKNNEKPNNGSQNIQDTVLISEEGKRKLLERIEGNVAERVKRREEEFYEPPVRGHYEEQNPLYEQFQHLMP